MAQVTQFGEREESTIYFCNPHRLKMIFETPDSTDQMDGSLSHMRDYILMTKPKNVTFKWIAYPGVGEKINGTDGYTGCTGLVQSGRADLMTYLLHYPVDMVNVSQGQVFYEDRYGYIGSFPFAKFEPFNVAKIFSSFDTNSWIIIFSLLFIFRLLIFINFKLLLKYYPLKFQSIRRQNYTFRVLVHFIEKGRIEDNTVTLKAIWFLLTLFSFFSIYIFYGLTKTGSVMSKPPLIFEDYDHLIKQNIMPTLLSVNQELFTKPGSPEYKLWTWARANFAESELIVGTENRTEQIAKCAIETGNYKRVSFAISFLLNIIRTTMCDFMARGGKEGFQKVLGFLKSAYTSLQKEELRLKNSQFQVYIKYPKSMKSQMLQVVYSQNSPYQHHMQIQSVKLFEHGFIHRERKNLDDINIAKFVLTDFEFVFGSNKIDRHMKHICMQSSPVGEERSADQISVIPLVAMRTCFEVFLFSIFISSIYFIREWLIFLNLKSHLNNRPRSKDSAAMYGLKDTSFSPLEFG